MAINFNDYLKMTGLGESAPITRRRKRNVKPGKFNPIAFAEAYSYVIQDGRRMRLSGIANQREASRISARGEAGLEDAKQFVKDKYKQVKEFLKKLIDKVIKFFTETLRYYFSNERKLAKAIAKLKAAKKTKKEELSVPVYKGQGKGESYFGYGEAQGNRRNTNRDVENILNEAVQNEQDAIDMGRVADDLHDELRETQGNLAKERRFRKGATALASKFKSERDEARGRIGELERNLFAAQAELENKNKIINLKIAENSAQADELSALRADNQRLEKLIKVLVDTIKDLMAGEKITNEATLGEFSNGVATLFAAAKTKIDASVSEPSMEEGADVVREAIDEFKECANAIATKKIETETQTIKKAEYLQLVDALLDTMEKMKAAKSMRTIQNSINDLKKEKAALEKDWKKESKDHRKDENNAMVFQLRRGALQGQIKLSNIYIGVNDKIAGRVISYAGKLSSAA